VGQLNELQIKAAQPRDKEYMLSDGGGLVPSRQTKRQGLDLPLQAGGQAGHRRHSALNYLSPNNFERKHQENTINTKTQIIPELQ